MTTTTITTIDQAPILIVWVDELIHTEANNFTCNDPSCPCHEDEAPIVDSVCDNPYCDCRAEYEDYIDDDDYPSEEQIEAMYSDYSGWQSDYL